MQVRGRSLRSRLVFSPLPCSAPPFPPNSGKGIGLGCGRRRVLGQRGAFPAGLCVLPAVNPEVAPLAGGYDVVWVLAGGVTGANVGGGEADPTAGEAGIGLVGLDTASPAVQSAKPEAFAARTCAVEFDVC